MSGAELVVGVDGTAG